MKKSELKKIIKECISEVISEDKSTGGAKKIVAGLIDQYNAQFDTSKIAAKTTTKSWTRGDGAKLKDWMSIRNSYNVDLDEFAETHKDAFMEMLISLGAKKTFTVSGEHGSDSKSEAYIYKNIIFIPTDWSIKFGTKSKLKNTSVWRTGNPN